MKTISLNFSGGMNNKARAESIPQGNKIDPRGFARSAINVDIDNAGNIRNRPLYKKIYLGDCHSIYKRYFVEGGDLKYLNADNTATTIKAGVGDGPISYTSIAGRVYFSNGVVNGSIINGNYQEWGLARPTFQPTATARTSGDMFAGDYQVAITWLRKGEESGAILASRITIPDGGGVRLSDFPVPPDDIDQVAVYVSSVNSKDLYLFSEYSANVGEVFIDKHISTIPLITQFGNKPNPFTIVQGHRGRVYGSVDNLLYYSLPQNYGLFKPNNYWRFPDNITCVMSVGSTMYVATKNAIFHLSNIDLEGGVQRNVAKEYGAPLQLNNPDDIDNELVYFRSNKGDCVASVEGIKEITATHVAMDKYRAASLTLIESDGIKRLVGVSQGIEQVSELKAKV